LKNLLWTALICLLLLGCEPTPPALPLPGPALIFDLTGSGAFFDRPWPASLRTVDGKPDLSGLPNPTRRKWIDSLIGLGSKETDGFSPTGPIYFLFDGPVATPSADPLDRLSADSPILLVNIDPKSAEFGKKHLCHVRVTESKDSFRPANLLQILPVPGLGLLEHTRYAAIVRTTLGNPDGAVLAQHADLASMLAGKIPAGARAAGMRVIGFDPRPDFPLDVAERAESLHELLEQSDVVSIHVNYEEATRHLFRREHFERMKNSSVLINTSRGGIVDDEAMLWALDTGQIAGAALDVLDGEPHITASHSVIEYSRNHSNVLVVPHIGGNTEESFVKTETFLALRVLELARTGALTMRVRA